MREPGADADHVGDGVERADLVEVHVARVAAVHGALGDGQPLEGPGREVAHRRVEGGGGQQVADVAPGAVLHGVGQLDVAAGGGEAVAGDVLDAQRHRFGGDRVHRGLQHRDRDARAQQGAEQHVAAGARGGVDPDRHASLRGGSAGRGAARRATRAAKTPAP